MDVREEGSGIKGLSARVVRTPVPSTAAVMYRARSGSSKAPPNNPSRIERYDVVVRMTMTGSRQAQCAVIGDGFDIGRRQPFILSTGLDRLRSESVRPDGTDLSVSDETIYDLV